MKLAIIGSGRIGKSLGGWAAASGYDVVFAARDEGHAREAAAAAGHGASAASAGEAVKDADLVLLAVPYRSVEALLGEIGPRLSGKTVIDPTNALNPEFNDLVFRDTSAAERIAALIPEAKVVKAFNTVFARHFEAREARIGGLSMTVVYAGDDAVAKAQVRDLISTLGFDAIDGGPLRVSRDIEPLGMLNIRLSFHQDLGSNIGFALLRKG